MNKFFRVLIALSLAAATAPILAQNEESAAKPDPAAKAKEVCSACHGLDGNLAVTPETPKIGGQPADYLARALHEYKSGGRKNPIMGAMAAGLSDAEIKGLAQYFSAQKSEVYVKY